MRKGCYKRYITQVCVSFCISKILWTNGRLGGGRKHQYQCGWRDWGKLPMIIWVCRDISECVGLSTMVIFTSRESRVGSNKVHNQNAGSWICGYKGSQITFKDLCVLWGRGTCNHGLSYCAFSHQSMYYYTCRITECGRSINGSTIGTWTKNSYSIEQIERHGVGKPIGTTKLMNLSIYSKQEQKTKSVFTSMFCTIEDTNG